MIGTTLPGVRVRPLERDDLAALEPVDRAYAERHALEPVVSAASLSLYARSGHSFVAEPALGSGPVPFGFVLAQAVWTGARPLVRLARLALAARAGSSGDGAERPPDEALRALLAEALVKSAYDAAVYDLEAVVPESDRGAHAALESLQYERRPARVYTRALGSRGRT